MKKIPKQYHTRDKILDVARDLFLDQGFSATSIDAICREARITKGGFFHYFKSKEDLGKAALNRFCESSHKLMQEEGCCQKNPDPLDRVFANLDCVIGYAKRTSGHKGCLIATFAQEMSQTHPEIQSMCVDGLRGWAGILKNELKMAKKKYIPRSSLDVGSLADHCVSVVEGAQILAKATKSVKPMEESIGHLKKYLTILFKTTKPRRIS